MKLFHNHMTIEINSERGEKNEHKFISLIGR
jgi:hypothetical protein